MVYTEEELYKLGVKKTFSREATEAAFLLGGIGTGNVSLGSRGQLRDWEIFNKPGKGNIIPNAHFTIWAKEEGKRPVARLLQSKIADPLRDTNGMQPYTAGGFPHMDNSTLRGEYPIVWVDFEDSHLPVHVKLEAFTPFIPLNVDDSSIPGALFTYSVTNTSDYPVDVTIAASMMNPIGGIAFDEYGNVACKDAGQNINELRKESLFAGIYFHGLKYGPETLKYGNMSIVTTNTKITHKTKWYRGEWYDYNHDYWDDFEEDGKLNEIEYDTPSEEGFSDTGSIGAFETIEPNETKIFQFILTWYFPNRINGWNEEIRVREPGRETVRNYYTKLFKDSWHAASYLIYNFERLKKDTFSFHHALHSTTLPGYVIDAVANNLTVMRSTTCFHLDNGRFYGYEGCFCDGGCCNGSCTHVWNFAQAIAFLFPSLEKSMRRIEFLEEVEENGKMNFRAYKGFDSTYMWKGMEGPPAADGQMGTITRAYREWKFTGEDEFIKELWPMIKKALHFAFQRWDNDNDFVLDSDQHVSYDIELYGPNPLTSIHLLGALKAVEVIAAYLGEREYAQKLGEIFAKSSKRADELLWNGEYYIQLINDVNLHKYQIGKGCLSDQMVGQQLAHIVGLGYLLPKERVKSAVYSIYKYNFRENFLEHCNCQRAYTMNDEKGLLLCSWPDGGRPRFPFVYSDEVWPGVEYAAAVNLIFEGYTEEALTIIKAIQDRHDGFRRNPWNEIECGNHYARSMASWGILIAFAGYQFDLVKGEIHFSPVLNQEDYSTFWSTGKAWGIYSQKRNGADEWDTNVQVLFGDASGLQINACGKKWTL